MNEPLGGRLNRRDLIRTAAAPAAAMALSASGLEALAAPPSPSEADAWRARPSRPVLREDKVVSNGAVRLGGTLFLPEGGRGLGAVVALHGASSPLRASPLYRHLTEILPALGIAVFIYDRRGSGQSNGDRGAASFDDLADDGIAAVEMLRRDPRIDPERIGVWGLSQGGWLSVLAASRSPHVRFAVAVSAPVVTADVQMLFSSTNTLRVFGYSQADIDQMTAARRAVDDYMRGTGDRAAAQRAVDAAKGRPWFRYLYMGETVRDREVSQWRREIEHDPLAALQKVKVPILVMYGATDPVVPVAISVERLARIAPRHPHMRVVVIAGADHGMQTDMPPRDLLDPAHADDERPNSAEYFAVLAQWLATRRLTGPA